MAEIGNLAAEARPGVGKGAARASRRAGRVPAIVYGGGGDPVPVSVDGKEIGMALKRSGFFSRLYDLALAGDTYRVLPRDVQFHPVTDVPLHIDFLRLKGDSLVDVEVAVHFLNEEESPGIKRGGVLNIVRRAIELRCRADSIPEIIEIDLTGRDIGDSIHISAVPLPAGAQPTITDRDFTIATIAAPTVVVEPVDEEAEGEMEEGVEGAEEAAAEGEAETEGS